MCQTRADGLGLKAEVVKGEAFEFGKDVCGVLVQYPDTQGTVKDYKVCVCVGSGGGDTRGHPRWRGVGGG